MKAVKLNVTKRDLSLGKGNLNRQRKEGYIPAIVYGSNVGTIPVTVIRKDLQALLSQHGNNAIIALNLEGRKPVQVMIKEIQTHPVAGHLWHVDFAEVYMNKPIRTEVYINFDGEPQGVDKGGIVQYGDTAVEIECLPNEIPENLSMDISNLEIGDKLTVGDLNFAENIQILSEPEQVLVSVVPPRMEVEDEEEPAGEGTEENNQDAE